MVGAGCFCRTKNINIGHGQSLPSSQVIKVKSFHEVKSSFCVVRLTVSMHRFLFDFFFQDEETQTTLNNDYEVGNLIKDRIIPHAVLFFTGENMVDDEVCINFMYY